jgi:hypothetical protein
MCKYQFFILNFIWTSSSSGFCRDIPKSAYMPNWTLVSNMIQLCLLCSLFGWQGPHRVDKLCLDARPCLHNHYFLSGKNYEVIKCYLLTAKKNWWKTPKAFKLQQKTLRVANQLGKPNNVGQTNQIYLHGSDKNIGIMLKGHNHVWKNVSLSTLNLQPRCSTCKLPQTLNS